MQASFNPSGPAKFSVNCDVMPELQQEDQRFKIKFFPSSPERKLNMISITTLLGYELRSAGKRFHLSDVRTICTVGGSIGKDDLKTALDKMPLSVSGIRYEIEETFIVGC